MNQATQALINAITLCPCNSSQIHAHGYNPETRTLALQFKRKGENGERVGGSVYHYDDVAPEVYDGLCKAESKGKFFGANIKNGGFAYRKIEAEAEAKADEQTQTETDQAQAGAESQQD